MGCDSKCKFDIYHRDKTIACFCRKILTHEELLYCIDNCLKENTLSINWTNQSNLNDSHLEKLSQHTNAKRIKYLNLSGTNITYDGLRFLFKSLTFASVRDEDPIYESYYNKPVSVVKIEIKDTPAIKQYMELLEKKKRIFPLPLRSKFTIIYFSNKKENGFKQLLLMNNGEIL